VQAALDLVRRHGIFTPSSVERVDSYTSDRALVHTDRPDPRSDLEAKFSVQYCVSRALTQGSVVLDDFEGGAYRDPAAQVMLRKVRAAPYTGPVFCADDPFDAEVKVTLTDGRVLEAKVDRPLGRTAENPISRDALDAKFLDCASRVLPLAAAAALCHEIWAMEHTESVQALTRMCEPDGVARGKQVVERAAV